MPTSPIPLPFSLSLSRCNFQQSHQVRVDEVEKAESQNGCGRGPLVGGRKVLGRRRNGGESGGTSESGIMNNSERGIRLAAVRTSAIQKPNSLVVPS